jgi:pyruvate dehydrogenase E1 component beta subunit
MQAAELLKKVNIIVDVIDLRIVNPLLTNLIIKSVFKTKKLIVVDGGWKNYGLGAELIASVAETMGSEENYQFRRITIKDSPAPTSSVLEKYYYPNESDIVKITTQLMEKNC